jgi:tRNA modification GTPase
VVVRHAADELEIHCHGGLAAPEAVLASLVAGGAVRQDWKTWLETPYQKRRQETEQHAIERESRLALALVAGPRAARILTRQLTGCLDQELVRLAALGPGPDRLAAAERLLRAARVGLRVADPWRVVLAGPVNAGKSSLVNALAGHARSIVSAEPGTTRDLVTTRLVLGGWEIALVDTAGLRTTESAASATERAGIARAVAAAKAADLVLEVAAADGDGARATSADGRVLVVITKADLAPTAWSPPVGAILTSVKEHRGIAELAAAIVARLVPEEQEDPDLLAGPVPFTARQVELIRRLGRGCG